MRPLVAAAALTFLLAGCTGLPGEDTSSAPSLLGYCPQWLPGPGILSERSTLAAHDVLSTRLDPPAGLRYAGLPVDLVTLRVSNLTVTEGAVAVRAFADANGTMGAQLALRSYRAAEPAFVPVLAFASAADAQREFEVLLSGVAGGPAPAPGPLWLTLTNEGGARATLELEARFQYRVCGA